MMGPQMPNLPVTQLLKLAPLVELQNATELEREWSVFIFSTISSSASEFACLIGGSNSIATKQAASRQNKLRLSILIQRLRVEAGSVFLPQAAPHLELQNAAEHATGSFFLE